MYIYNIDNVYYGNRIVYQYSHSIEPDHYKIAHQLCCISFELWYISIGRLLRKYISHGDVPIRVEHEFLTKASADILW